MDIVSHWCWHHVYLSAARYRAVKGRLCMYVKGSCAKVIGVDPSGKVQYSKTLKTNKFQEPEGVSTHERHLLK